MSRDPNDTSVGEWVAMIAFFTFLLGGTGLFFWTAAKYLVLFLLESMGWGAPSMSRIVAIAVAVVLFLDFMGWGLLRQLLEENDPNRNWP